MKVYGKLLEDIRSNKFVDASLHLEGTECGESDAVELADALRNNEHITTLFLSDNCIGDEGAIALSTIGQNDRSKLHTVNVIGNSIGEMGAAAFATSRFTTLILNDNPIRKGIIPFSNNETIVELSASSCGIDDEGANALFLNPKLKKLDLSNNRLTGDLPSQLFGNKVLEHLNLSYNPLNGRINKGLTSDHLITFDLSNTMLKDDGAIEIASKCTRLEELNLNENNIGDEGATALARLLNLRTLSLSGNKIKNEGAVALFSGQKLTRLLLGFNQIDDDCIEACALANKRMHLELNGNSIARPMIQSVQLQNIPERKDNSDQSSMPKQR